MKRLAFWGAVCIVAVTLQLAVTFRRLVPHIDDFAYVIRWSSDVHVATGWHALTPYYAWPILVTYGGALIVLALPIGMAVWRYMMQQERQDIAGREAAAAARVQEAERILVEAKEIKQAAQDEVQTAMDQVARREQEAAAQVEDAEAKLRRSVSTNIGRQKTIQKLRERVTELEERVTMGHC